MRSAYNETWIQNLALVKEAKSLYKSNWITEPQNRSIAEVYASPVYHPNFLIRILLFIATLFGLSGVTGLFALMVIDTSESFIAICCIFYGIMSLVFLEMTFIKKKYHYKSGVNEALLYHSCGFTGGGIILLLDLNPVPALIVCFVIICMAAFRYLDLLSTLTSVIIFAYILFIQLYEWGSIFQQIIPFAFISCFSVIYFITKVISKKPNTHLWHTSLLIVESFSLVIICLAGNYLVVRELTVNLMNLSLAAGEDIPFAYLFYLLTVLVPFIYLYFGIRQKDVVLLRTSLMMVTFSVFTFDYYYGVTLTEITLTIGGIILLGISLVLFNYLRLMRNGYTRENLMSEKWANMNVEAFIISQTMGGNQVKSDESFQGKGGEFGGGGSTGSF